MSVCQCISVSVYQMGGGHTRKTVNANLIHKFDPFYHCTAKFYNEYFHFGGCVQRAADHVQTTHHIELSVATAVPHYAHTHTHTPR